MTAYASSRSSREADVVHVAEAGENRGRVVLRLGSPAPDPIALAAAVRLARAYQAELESIFIEDQQLIDICSHPNTTELSLCGRDRRQLSAVTLMRQFAYAARQAERQVAIVARRAEIAYRARTIRDEPTHALNRACAESGPWNVIVLADPVRPRDQQSVQRLLDEVAGATGLILVGSAVRRINGPVAIVVESIERLPLLLRVGERIAAEADVPLLAILSTDTADQAAVMEDHVRLLLGERDNVMLVTPTRTHGHPGALLDAVRRLSPGFLIGQAGGALLPVDAGWQDLARSLECPLFVVR